MSSLCSWSYSDYFAFPRLTPAGAGSRGRRAGMLLGQMWVSDGKRERRGPAEGRSGGCQGAAGTAPQPGRAPCIPACPEQPRSADCTHKVFRKIKGNHAYVRVFVAGFLWLAFYHLSFFFLVMKAVGLLGNPDLNSLTWEAFCAV